jgi:hypothetical protein
VGVHVGEDKWLTSFTCFFENLKVEFKSFKKTVKIGCRSGPFGPLGWAAIHQQGLAFFQK